MPQKLFLVAIAHQQLKSGATCKRWVKMYMHLAMMTISCMQNVKIFCLVCYFFSRLRI